MTRWLAACGALALITAGVVLLKTAGPTAAPTVAGGLAETTDASSDPRQTAAGRSSQPSPRATASGPAPPAPVAPPPGVALPPAAVPPMPAEFSNTPPAVILESLRTCFRDFGSAFGGNPVGTNPEITSALNGGNPKQTVFLRQDGNRINSRGELVDAWGTPYFFHQLSALDMEIHSAGPDLKMWTDDDLVIK